MPELICAADDPRWLDERRKGVTATDIPAICGLSPYESLYSLYWKKLGHIDDTHQDNDRLRLGRDLEPIIIGRFQDSGSLRVTASGQLFRSGMRSWQLATIDAMTRFGEPAELKSWADADRRSWDDGPPPRVRAQVLWQMDTLDAATGHVGVLFLPSGEFRSYVIGHEQAGHVPDWTGEQPSGTCDACDDLDLMRAAAEEFMARLRLELPPPSPDASTATLAALKARFADPAKTKEAEISRARWDDYVAAKAALHHQEHWVHGLEAHIREEIGDAGIITVNGVKVATRQRYTVREHIRKESTVDKIVRSKGDVTDV